MFYKIYAWFCVVLGGLAIWASISDSNYNLLIGGGMFLTAGIMILKLKKELK